MTNREYLHKQHRGSTPSRIPDSHPRNGGPDHLPSEEWKSLTWYPVSSVTNRERLNTQSQGRNATPGDK